VRLAVCATSSNSGTSCAKVTASASPASGLAKPRSFIAFFDSSRMRSSTVNPYSTPVRSAARSSSLGSMPVGSHAFIPAQISARRLANFRSSLALPPNCTSIGSNRGR
jgi:hypothetical protein